MSLDQATLNRQLGRAKEDLAAWIKVMEKNGVAATARRKDATWRHLNSACNTIRIRLKAANAITTRDEEAAKRKAEKLTADTAVVEKAPKKASKAPKPAKEKGVKAKAEGKKTEKAADAKDKKKKEK